MISEILSSLYAGFIKDNKLGITNQFFIRALVYIVLSLFSLSNVIINKTTILLSILNYFHVYLSYYAFKELKVGISILLFYIYPLFYMLFNGITDIKYYILLSICLYSVYLIYNDTKHELIDDIKKERNKMATIAIILSALTEALTFFIVRNVGSDSSHNELFMTYIIPLSILLFKADYKELKENKEDTKNSLLFNIGIGYISYYMLYNVIKTMDPAKYSIYTFIGIITGFVSGKIMFNESYGEKSVYGIILILISMLITSVL